MGQPYEYRGMYIPDRMMDGIRRYTELHIRPGDFLCAVISNDLKEACGHADDENFYNIPAFVAYLYNEAPAPCWGSREKLEAWVKPYENSAEAAS